MRKGKRLLSLALILCLAASCVAGLLPVTAVAKHDDDENKRYQNFNETPEDYEGSKQFIYNINNSDTPPEPSQNDSNTLVWLIEDGKRVLYINGQKVMNEGTNHIDGIPDAIGMEAIGQIIWIQTPKNSTESAQIVTLNGSASDPQQNEPNGMEGNLEPELSDLPVGDAATIHGDGNVVAGPIDGSGENDAPENGVQDADQSFTTVAGRVDWLSNVSEFEKVSVTIYLLRDDKVIASQVVTADTDGNYSFENLPIRDNEHTYTYTIKVDLDSLGKNYSPSVNGTDVSVIHHVPVLEKYIQKDVHENLPAFDTPFTYTINTISRAAGEDAGPIVWIRKEPVLITTLNGSASDPQQNEPNGMEGNLEPKQNALPVELIQVPVGDAATIYGDGDGNVVVGPIEGSGEEPSTGVDLQFMDSGNISNPNLFINDTLMKNGGFPDPDLLAMKNGIFVANTEKGLSMQIDTPADVVMAGRAQVDQMTFSQSAEGSTMYIGGNSQVNNLTVSAANTGVTLEKGSRVNAVTVDAKGVSFQNNGTVGTFDRTGNAGDAVYTGNEITNTNTCTNHIWSSRVTYTWSKDNRICTASHQCRICGKDEQVGISFATASGNEATCTNPGTMTYIAEFVSTSEIKLRSQTKKVKTDPLGHAPMTILAKAPTCTEFGWNEYIVCSRCEWVDGFQRLDPLDHDFGEWMPSPTESGMEIRVCQRPDCGETEKRAAPATPTPHAHTPGDPVEENKEAATCLQEGSYDEVVYCTGCGEEISRQQKTLEKLPHTPVDDAAVAATCTAAGKTAGSHCSVCNTVLTAQTEVPALDHTPVDDAAVAATCTAAGKTAGSHCSVCNTVLTAQTEVPALGHTPVDDAAVAATCTAAGKTAGSHCSVCNTVLTAQTEVPALGHTPVDDAAVAATCTEPGKTAGSHCSVCNTVLTAQTEVPALGHTPVEDAAVAATCTEPGKTAGSHCSVCNTVLTAQTEVPALEHTPVEDAAVAATCTAAGKTAGSHCSVCNTVLTAQTEIPALGHTPVEDAAVAATCTAAGKTAGSHCSVCNTVLTAQTEVSALGHTPVEDAAVAATCTEPGKTAGSHCSVCNTVLTAQTEIPALNHDWGEWGDSTATCTAAGTETRACRRTDCGATETRDAAALGHTGGTATCQALAVCTRCGEPYGELGEHSYVQTEAGKDPSCTEPGFTPSYCCSVHEDAVIASKPIDPLNHNYVNGICTRCGEPEPTVTPEN